MSVFDRARAKVRELKNSLNPTIQRTLEQYKDVIIDFQVNEQLFKKGQDAKGSIIRPAYKPITIKLKRQKGQPVDRVTLKDTGKFHKSITVIPSTDSVEIIASVPYAKYLFRKYGDDVLGIQEELLRDFVNKFLLPNIKKEINDTLAKS